MAMSAIAYQQVFQLEDERYQSFDAEPDDNDDPLPIEGPPQTGIRGEPDPSLSARD
jgi:hypothetical protein